MKKPSCNLLAQYLYAKIINQFLPSDINNVIAKLFLQLNHTSIYSIFTPHTLTNKEANIYEYRPPIISENGSFLIHIHKPQYGYTIENTQTQERKRINFTKLYDICLPSNKIAYVISDSNNIMLHNIITNTLFYIATENTPPNLITLSPNGRYIATAHDDHIMLYDTHNHTNIQSQMLYNDLTMSLQFSNDSTTLIASSKNYDNKNDINTWKINDIFSLTYKKLLAGARFDDFLISSDQKTITLFNNNNDDISFKYSKIITPDGNTIHLDEPTTYNKYYITSYDLTGNLVIRNINGMVIYSKKINNYKQHITFSNNQKHILVPTNIFGDKYTIIHFDHTNDTPSYQKETEIQLPKNLSQFCYITFFDINKQGLILLEYNNKSKKHACLFDKQGNNIIPPLTNVPTLFTTHFSPDGRNIIAYGNHIMNLYDQETEKKLTLLEESVNCEQTLFLMNANKQKSFIKNSHENYILSTFNENLQKFIKKTFDI